MAFVQTAYVSITVWNNQIEKIMASETAPPRYPVHLVGSVPLENAGAVLDLTGNILGGRCRRFPDGETGERRNWIGWQLRVFEGQAALRQAARRERDYQLHPPFEFSPGKGAVDLAFGELGFAREAIAGFALFESKQSAGVIPAEARFLVAIPTPFAPVYSFTAYAVQGDVFPVYEAAILRELDEICASLPHEALAIQWDVATEMSIFEGVYGVPFDDAWEVLNGRLATLGNAVPEGVELGFHLCYGSMNNRHWKEPDDLGMCVRVANDVLSRLGRPMDFLHMPVPVDRSDDGFFAPLGDLRLAHETELYLGLVHDDGPDGNRTRLETAARHWDRFGISAECGLGRWETEDVPRLIQAHADLVDARIRTSG